MKIMKCEFWHYVSLGILGMIGSAGTILTDAYFVADRLGATGLAAMNISMCMFGLMNGTGLLFGIGGAIRYTIRKVKGNSREANETFVLSFFAALLLGVLYAIIGLLFSKQISYVLGANSETIAMCNIYLKTILCFAPAFVINHLLMAFVRNDGSPNLSTKAMMIGSITNIVLDYVFMYPLNMGLFGAAFATGVAAFVGISISVFHFFSGRGQLNFVYTRISVKEIIKIISLGMSAFVTELSSSIVVVVFNLLILNLAGNLGVAAYGIVANLALMVLAVMNGISHGLQPLFSKMHGKGKNDVVQKLYHKGLILAFATGLAVFLAAVGFAPVLVRCFNNDGNMVLQLLAEDGLKLYFVGFLFVGYNYLTASYFSATEKPKLSFIIAVFRGLVGIIIGAVLLSYYFGMTGIWLAFAVVELMTIVLCKIFKSDYKLKTVLNRQSV